MWSESAISNDQVKLVLNQCGQVKLVFRVCRDIYILYMLSFGVLPYRQNSRSSRVFTCQKKQCWRWFDSFPLLNLLSNYLITALFTISKCRYHVCSIRQYMFNCVYVSCTFTKVDGHSALLLAWDPSSIVVQGSSPISGLDRRQIARALSQTPTKSLSDEKLGSERDLLSGILLVQLGLGFFWVYCFLQPLNR